MKDADTVTAMIQKFTVIMVTKNGDYIQEDENVHYPRGKADSA